MPKLEIKNLKKSFGGAEILHAVSFTVESGQVAAVIGSSGSGKTTRGGSPLYFHRKPSEGFPCPAIRPCPGSFRYWSDDPYKKRRNCYVCILAS